jgi:tripartite-type tricarboxylate transporter receptor subunit TctC
MMYRRLGSIVIAGLLAVAEPAHAQTDYPTRAIQIVVPFTAGGNTDLIARLIADRLQTAFKQPVTVVNRPGGGMNIGSASVAISPPDGYTMLLAAPGSFVVNQFIYTNLTYDPDKAWAPVSLAARFPNVLVVHPSLGVKSIQELIAKANAEPGKINYAIAGVGATSHLSGALFAEMAGIQVNAIPYKGTSDSLRDLVAGHVPYTIDNLGPILPHIRNGQLIALGVTTKDPVSLLPNVPTIGSVLKGYELSSWNGLAMPAGTPKAIVEKVSAEVHNIVNSPEVAEKMRSFGSEPVGGTPAQTEAFIKEERPRWEAAVKAAKIPKEESK